MQLKCPGFSIKGITTDIRYGSPFQRKWDKTPLKKKRKKDVSNKSQLGVRVQVIQSSELPVHLNTFQQTVDGHCSGLRVRQVLGEQTTIWHQEGSNSKPRSLLLPSVRAVLYNTVPKLQTVSSCALETFISIVMVFFFFSNASKAISDRCSHALFLVRPPELYIFESSGIDGCNLLTLRVR